MIRPIQAGDIDNLKVQEAQLFYRDSIKEAVDSGSLENTFAYIEHGKIRACIGMQVLWEGRAIVWALIGDVSNWVKFHKTTKRLLEDYAERLGVIRLEMTTEVGFVESERWAYMLGFRCESEMANYGPDGKNHKMWVRLWQQHQ